jgi:hypothetical protein
MRLCAAVTLAGPGNLGDGGGGLRIIGGWALEALCQAQQGKIAQHLEPRCSRVANLRGVRENRDRPSDRASVGCR